MSKTGLEIKLSGEDGNAFFIIGRGIGVLRRAGYSPETIKEFIGEATSSDYDHVIQTMMEWFDVV